MMFDYTGTYTDQYQLSMAQTYFLKNRHKRMAVFDYFFRKTPFNSGYAVFAGLADLLDALENLCFNAADIAYLRRQGMNSAFLDHLKDFHFTGTIHSACEGDLVFPTRPVLRVEAELLQAQVIETILLNILNFQTLIATKASRARVAAGDRILIDFGLRRAHGPGGYYASRAAVIGGFNATSNVRVGRDYGIPVSGTMAHSLVQSYEDELTAFRHFAQARPDDCVLLVDTYDTLASGVPNAITVGLEMRRQGRRLKGIRLDSGDLAHLAIQARAMLDAAGLSEVIIAASNQLDEYRIKDLMDRKAPIDVFGVGTSLVTGHPDAALDGVYKLASVDSRPCIKLSEAMDKITLPHKKQVFRLRSGGALFGGDVTGLWDETDIGRMHHPFDPEKSLDIGACEKEPLLCKVVEKGRRLFPGPSVLEIAGFAKKRLAELPAGFKRFEHPDVYKIGISTRLKEERDRLIAAHHPLTVKGE